MWAEARFDQAAVMIVVVVVVSAVEYPAPGKQTQASGEFP